jgi:metallo-beta-lactamase class B
MTRTWNIVTMAAALAAAPVLAPASADASGPGGESAAAHTPARLAKACAGRDGWLDAAPPARIFANTWYVGTCGISAILVTGKEGHVLVDAGMTGAAPAVLANIRRAGFEPRDIRWIVASHEHHDHVGALAALQRATGAKVAAVASQKVALESGKPSAGDPQSSGLDPIAPVRVERVLADGDTVKVGSLVLTAHVTPVHAPGSTSWTWRSCTDKGACLAVAYADSSSTISTGSYRFSDHPERIAGVRQGIAAMSALPCEILLTPHPAASAMMERFEGTRPLADAQACRAYAAGAKGRFAARLADEQVRETSR